MAKTYYEVLGVAQTASFDEIKRAFRIKAKDCHPDHHAGDPVAEKQFKELAEAYEVLKDDQKRATYDRIGHEAFVNGMGNSAFSGGFGGFDFSGTGFEDIFAEMFGMARGRPKNKKARGEDIRLDLGLTLDEAYHGIKKTVTLNTYSPCAKCGGLGGKRLDTCATCGGAGVVRQRQGFFVVETTCPVCHGTGKAVQEPCADCRGTGRVRQKRDVEIDIPAGVDTGVRMRLAGEGDVAPNGGDRGDVYVFLNVKPHALFKREGNDLYIEVPVPMTTATLGGKVFVPTMNGKGQEYDVKAGLQSGTEVKLKGFGMPVLRGDRYGDLYVRFRVETPTNLSAEQKELLRQFDGAGKKNSSLCEDFKNLVSKIFS
ncbi:MAG: molecular chaperone DnaJ [Alphaproteobacteria bacterium]|nr:molecular chaperone DnaJ [Alphaproteobacteria bacterium]